MKSDETNNTNQSQEDEIDLLDLIGVLWKRKFLIIGITSIAAIIILAFVVVSTRLPPERSPLPNVYKPHALILVNDSSGGSSLQSAINSSGLGSLAGLAGVSSFGGGYGDLAVKLLSGNTGGEAVYCSPSSASVRGVHSISGSTR